MKFRSLARGFHVPRQRRLKNLPVFPMNVPARLLRQYGDEAVALVLFVEHMAQAQQPGRGAGCQQGLVELIVALFPFRQVLAEALLCLLQAMVGRDQVRLPLVTAVPDTLPQRFTFQHDPHAAEVPEIVRGNGRDTEAPLFFHGDEAFAGQAIEGFA